MHKFNSFWIIVLLIAIIPTVSAFDCTGCSSAAEDYYFLDDFIDPDDTAITSHTAETGQTWGSDAGSEVIKSNAMYYPAPANQRPKVSFGDPEFNLTCIINLNMSTSLANNFQFFLRNGGTETTTIAIEDDGSGNLRYLTTGWNNIGGTLVLGDNVSIEMDIDITHNNVNYSGFTYTNSSSGYTRTIEATSGWIALRNSQTSVDEIWLNLGNGAGEGHIKDIMCWNVTDGNYGINSIPQTTPPPPDLTPPGLLNQDAWCTSCDPVQQITNQHWQPKDPTMTGNATINESGTCAVIGAEGTPPNYNYTDAIANGGVEATTTGTTDQIYTLQDSNFLNISENNFICVGCKDTNGNELLNATFCAKVNITDTDNPTINLIIPQNKSHFLL